MRLAAVLMSVTFETTRRAPDAAFSEMNRPDSAVLAMVVSETRNVPGTPVWTPAYRIPNCSPPRVPQSKNEQSAAGGLPLGVAMVFFEPWQLIALLNLSNTGTVKYLS